MTTTKTHTGTVTEYKRTDWGAKGRVKTGACELPFLCPISRSYMADDIDVGSIIEYGKDPTGAIHLPVVMSLVPPISEAVPYLNEDEAMPFRAVKDALEMVLSATTANNARLRDMLEKLPDV